MKNHHWFAVMGHTRLVATIGILISVSILLLMPSFKWLSGLVLGIVLLHIAMLLLLSLSVISILPERIKTKLRSLLNKKRNDGLYFGWSASWLNGYWIIATMLLALAIFAFHYFPNYHLVAFSMFLLSINLYIGNVTIRASKNTNSLVFPYVSFFNENSKNILDAGCGAGRTTVSLSKIYKGKIVALDTFDSGYIEGGGNTLIAKNIKIADIENRVQIVKGDITNTNFPGNYFDAVVSTYMIDHLGNLKYICLKEINRILKPGGRLLMIVIVPNLTSFAIANVFSFLLTSRKKWKKLVSEACFKLIEEGEINGAAYFLIEK